MTSRTRYAEFSGDAADLRLVLEKAKTSATRKDEHGLARMVFEGVDLAPDDTAQMKRIKARVASVRPLVRSTATTSATGARRRGTLFNGTRWSAYSSGQRCGAARPCITYRTACVKEYYFTSATDAAEADPKARRATTTKTNCR